MLRVDGVNGGIHAGDGENRLGELDPAGLAIVDYVEGTRPPIDGEVPQRRCKISDESGVADLPGDGPDVPIAASAGKHPRRKPLPRGTVQPCCANDLMSG